MKSYLAKKGEVARKWWLVDADGQILGRLSTQIAGLLRGKTKPEFTPNVDTGDFVIVVNAEKIKLTGKKELQKVYQRHSGTPGGFRTESARDLKERIPQKLIKFAVKGMVPHTTLGTKQLTKLKIYKGESHPHKSQKVQKLELT